MKKIKAPPSVSYSIDTLTSLTFKHISLLTALSAFSSLFLFPLPLRGRIFLLR